MVKAALYLRLSKEDLDKIIKGDDSESIKNQKSLLIDYAEAHSMLVYKIYSDDDFSGADNERPSWNEMIKGAMNKEFDIILCKTQSRFARSLEVVEKYINGLFLEWGIRFISVVDGIDNWNKGSRKTSQINGLVDQWYLEDISESIKAVFESKMKDGLFLGGFAPYGYKKDPNNKYKLIIDEEAAEVVRKIFKLYLKGHGAKQICNILTEEKIPTPTQYKESQGLSYKNPNSTFSTTYGTWGVSTIKRILTNRTYIGDVVQGMEKKASYKSKKKIKVPEEKWIIVESCHEPIIDIKDFTAVKEALKTKRTVSKNQLGEKKCHCFAGKVRCLDCHNLMVKSNGNSLDTTYLRCQLSSKTKQKQCTPHSIRFTKLESIVSEEIHKLINEILDEDLDITVVKEFISKDSIEKHINKLTKEKKNIEYKKKEIISTFKSLYLDKTKGLITEDMFVKLSKYFQKEIDNFDVKIKVIDSEIIENQKIQVYYTNIREMAKRHQDFTRLTSEVVNHFISYIEVGEKDIEDDVVNINIHWKV